jgi:hypothetical protein
MPCYPADSCRGVGRGVGDHAPALGAGQFGQGGVVGVHRVASVPGGLVGSRPSLRAVIVGCAGLPDAFQLASAAGSTIGSGGAVHHTRSLIEQPTEIRRPGIPAPRGRGVAWLLLRVPIAWFWVAAACCATCRCSRDGSGRPGLRSPGWPARSCCRLPHLETHRLAQRPWRPAAPRMGGRDGGLAQSADGATPDRGLDRQGVPVAVGQVSVVKGAVGVAELEDDLGRAPRHHDDADAVDAGGVAVPGLEVRVVGEVELAA